MARIILTSGLSNQFTSGQTELEIDAVDVRGLILLLDESFPGIGDELKREMAVAIDGQIYQEPFLEKISTNSEVYFLPRIGGGKNILP